MCVPGVHRYSTVTHGMHAPRRSPQSLAGLVRLSPPKTSQLARWPDGSLVLRGYAFVLRVRVRPPSPRRCVPRTYAHERRPAAYPSGARKNLITGASRARMRRLGTTQNDARTRWTGLAAAGCAVGPNLGADRHLTTSLTRHRLATQSVGCESSCHRAAVVIPRMPQGAQGMGSF